MRASNKLNRLTDQKRSEEGKVRLNEKQIADEKTHLLETEKFPMVRHNSIGGIAININILSELAQKTPDFVGIKRTLAVEFREGFFVEQIGRFGIHAQGQQSTGNHQVHLPM